MNERRLLARPGMLQVAMALVAYVPLLFAKPGTVGADTKVYLYLDPGRLLDGAPYLWQPDTGLGTITHQNIGYLWPMGPFYWLFELTGLPDWVAQRIWMGTLLFLAGLGVSYLLRTIQWEGGGIWVASFAYMLSPYVLDYVARISAILIPFAALPWLIALAAKSLRSGGWRYPALFSLVAFTAGGTNATSLLLIGIAPVLWILHERLNDPSVTNRKAALATARIGVLTLATALWWIVGLYLQGTYGLPIPHYTETYEVVASASTGPEVFRGLGLWFFYGGDKLAPWIEPSVTYTEDVPFLIISFVLPVLALASAGLTRFRHRSYFVALIPIGGLIAVGSHPFDEPSILGGLFKSFTNTDAGLALRSTPRAVPMLVLATSVLLGAGVSTLVRNRPRLEYPAVGVLLALVMFNMAPLFQGEYVGRYLSYENDAPGYWYDAARYLDGRDDGTRVLELPGTDFSAYRWGNTVDPVTPGLIGRPYVARELVPQGTPHSAALLKALDKTLQEGTYDPDSLAPIARLLGVGDVVLRADLQYERFRTPRPQLIFDELERTTDLLDPVTFGTAGTNIAGPEQPLIDEVHLAIGPTLDDPPAVVIYPVRDPVPIVTAVSAERPLLIAGDAEGLVAAASVDLLTDGQAVLYSASFASDPAGLDDALARGADLLVTDSNRRRAARWGTIRENDGYTERADEVPLVFDPTDRRLAVFPGADAEAQTVAVQRNASVYATDYGNAVTYTPEHRAVHAFDGDRSTAWKVGAFENPVGDLLRIELGEATSIDGIDLLQPFGGNRWITQLEVRVDGGSAGVFELDGTSFVDAGQRLDVVADLASIIEFEIVATNFVDNDFVSGGVSPVGIAEVSIGDLHADEWIEAPRDLLAAVPDDLDHRLALLFSRERTNPQEPVRTDPEQRMKRLVSLPSDRSFALGGEVRLSTDAPEPLLDELLGYPSVDDGGLRTNSSDYLPGDLGSRARSAFDGDPTTAWRTPFGDPVGHWIEVTRPSVQPVRELALDVVVDGQHSLPRTVTIFADGVEVQTVEVESAPQVSGRVGRLDLPIEPFEAATVQLRIDRASESTTRDWYSLAPVQLPVGVAEVVGLGTSAPPNARISIGCRDDLVTLGGNPVNVRVTGAFSDAVQRRELALETCSTDGVALTAGVVEVEAADGARTGLDVDRLVLLSERGGGPLRVGRHPLIPEAPSVTVTNEGRDHVRVEVEGGDGGDYWLVLGQSHSDGWVGPTESSTLINGYANGWLIAADDSETTFELRFWPQRLIWIGLALTIVGLLTTVGLALRGTGEYPLRRDERSNPRLFDARVRSRRFLRQSHMAVATLGIGAFSFVNLPEHEWAALAVAAALLLSFRGRRWLPLLPTLAAACLAAAAGYITLKQWRNGFVSEFIWPQRFEEVHVLGIVAMLFLAAEAVRAMVADDDRPLQDY